MVMQHDGGGSGFPPLPADAGPTERALYEIYDFQTGIVSYTASQWKTTADEITDLASSVRQVVRELRRAPDGGEAWSGSAAEAAYESLGKLATNLDRHAEDILNIEAGLTAASDAVSDARSAYVTRVRTVDTDIDQAGYMTGPPPPPVGPPVPKTLDTAAYDQAVSAARAQRESEAQSVMQAYDTRMETAAKKLPVEPAESPVSDGNYPSGPGTPGGYPGGSQRRWRWGLHAAEAHLGRPAAHRRRRRRRRRATRRSGSRRPATPTTRSAAGSPDGLGRRPDRDGRPDAGQRCPDALHRDDDPGRCPLGRHRGCRRGDGHGRHGRRRRCRGPLRSRRWRGPRPRLRSPRWRRRVRPSRCRGRRQHRWRGLARHTAGRPAVVARVRAARVAPPSSPAAAARVPRVAAPVAAGAPAGVVRGRTGRYGVPQLGEKGGRGGAAGAAGTAGSRGGRRKDERDGQDVDHLTHEDEETWFEGSDDASPPVWE